MSESWLKRFLSFAKTIDYVDEDIFENVKDLLERYFELTLGAAFFRVSIDGFDPMFDLDPGAGEKRALFAGAFRHCR